MLSELKLELTTAHTVCKNKFRETDGVDDTPHVHFLRNVHLLQRHIGALMLSSVF